MPATDFHGSAASFGRSILSLRREQIHSMESTLEATAHDLELETFQRQVADRFADLSSAGSDDLLSLSWIRKLLDSFLRCQEEFRTILSNNRLLTCKSPLDRMIHEFFERSVKALDICNAIRDGIEQIREWKKLIDIVLCALDNQRMLGEGQFRRAKKALIDLHISMLDEREPAASLAHRSRSFGRQNAASSKENRKNLCHFRSLLSSVSRSWSAARQLQAISNNLTAPKANEIMATNGIAVAVYTMNSILLFAMWALVAAIPCQDRGLQIHFSVPKNFLWSAPIMSLHDRIMDESRKRDRRNACGLLREIYHMYKCTKLLTEMAHSVQFPLTEEREMEVRLRVQELGRVSELIKKELDPLERQVREVFHRIVCSRTEGLDSVGRMNHNY